MTAEEIYRKLNGLDLPPEQRLEWLWKQALAGYVSENAKKQTLDYLQAHIGAAQAEARLEERRAIAEMVDDFSWTLPMYKSTDMNEASDDAAESVRRQIAKAIWGL